MGKHGMTRITGGLLGTAAVVLLAVGTSLPAVLAVPTASSQDQSGGVCIGHHPNPAAWYTGACSGHDEPELDPVSSLPGRYVSSQMRHRFLLFPKLPPGTDAALCHFR